MLIERFPGGPWKQNAFLVVNQGEALVIAPGGSADLIVEALADRKLNLVGILNTHGHFDHIGGVNGLIQKTGATFYISGREIPILKSANMYRYIYKLDAPIVVPKTFVDLDAVTQPMHLAGLSVHALHTPGHTPGSYSFHIDAHLFTGDTMLASAEATTALPGGDRSALLESIEALATLPPATIVHPGHGSDLSLGAALDRMRPTEREGN